MKSLLTGAFATARALPFPFGRPDGCPLARSTAAPDFWDAARGAAEGRTMQRSRLSLVLLVLPVLAGCHSFQTVGWPSGIADGSPPPQDFLAEGYRIWQDGQGWHLRTRSDLPRRFQGLVDAGWGQVTDFRPVGDVGQVQTTPTSFAFDFQTDASGERGFDWRATNGCNRFEVYIDGDARPLRVLLPEGDSPARIPFALCGG